MPNSPPTISGTPPTTVLEETPYLFVPSAGDADGDILHFSIANLPRWAAFEPTTGRLEGTPSSADVGTYEDVRISVTDGADDAHLQPFSITVTAVARGAVELSWLAPTENVDGSPLTDLAGYKIYWGTQRGDYPNSVTIDNPGIVTYILEGLVPGTYYFVATAFNTEGAESDPSDVASVTIS
ncbi:MAG TPA: putative Ig domain-containing protein [Gammaproteobacteria bacterium]